MQRPIPATSSLPHASAKAALSGIRKNLMYRGLTRNPYSMCAEIGRYGLGWAVYIGFQPDADLNKALAALVVASKKHSNTSLTWGFSDLTHSM